MPDQRQRTTIELAVDDRQLRNLDQAMDRAFDVRLLDQWERALDRLGQKLDKLASTADRLGGALGGATGGGGGRPGGGGGGAPGGGGGAPGGTPGARPGSGGGGIDATLRAILEAQRRGEQEQRRSGRRTAIGAGLGSYAGGLAARAPQGEGFVAQALGGIPFIGGLLSGAVSASRGLYGEYAAQETGISKHLGTLGYRPNAMRTMGLPYGQTRAESVASGANIAGQAGMSGGEIGLSENFFDEAMRYQQFGGVQNAASIVGAAGVGGQSLVGGAATKVMSQAVAAGVASGVREAKLGEFVSVATSVLEEGRRAGADITAAQLMQLQRGIAGMGASFTGERATRLMQGSAQALRNMNVQGDFASLVALRAAGLGQGGVGMNDAMQRLEENPEEVLPEIIKSLRNASGGNREAFVHLMRQVSDRYFGGRLSTRQMREMFSGDLGQFGEEAGTAEADTFIDERDKALRPGFQVARTEAAHRNTRADVGGEVAGSVVTIRNAELALMQETLPSVASGIGKLVGYVSELAEIYSREGFTGMMRAAVGDLLDLKNPFGPDPDGPLPGHGRGDRRASDRGVGAPATDGTGPMSVADQLRNDVVMARQYLAENPNGPHAEAAREGIRRHEAGRAAGRAAGRQAADEAQQQRDTGQALPVGPLSSSSLLRQAADAIDREQGLSPGEIGYG